jgi:hypothetical protein
MLHVGHDSRIYDILATCNLHLAKSKATSTNLQCSIQTLRMINVNATAFMMAENVMPAY